MIFCFKMTVLKVLIFINVVSVIIFFASYNSKKNSYFLINEIQFSPISSNQTIEIFQTDYMPILGSLLYRVQISKKRNTLISIGIPTVKRNGANYLKETMTSLIQNLSEEEKIYVLFVVFISEVM